MLSSLIVMVITIINGIVSQNCANPVRRPEIRELSPAQLTAFISAVKGLRNKNGTDIYSQSCSTHYSNVNAAHGVPAFFPWHREFLKRYELSLQSIDPTVVLPYWDWSRDAQAPETSVIFTNSYFGGNGQSSDNCVVSGPFANWKMTVGNPHCLKRQFSGGSTISSFYSGEALEAIINQANTFDQLRQNIEGGPHGTVHTGIGNNNGDMTFMYSPNDPIFYMHHAFVDLLWSEWQSRKPTLASTYNGQNGWMPVSSSNTLTPFNVQVSTTFNTKSTKYCYYYNRWSANSGAVAAASTTSNNPLRRRQSINEASSNLIQNSINNIISNQSSTQATENQVNQSIETVNQNIAVSLSPYDRSVRGKLRLPEPLSLSFISMNGLDVNIVRKTESFISNLFAKLNSMPGFTPYSDI